MGVSFIGRLRPKQTKPAIDLPDLADVYQDYASFVWRSVRRFGVPESGAEDLVHDGCIGVKRRLIDFDGRVSMAAWLYGITRRVVANHRRGQYRAERRLQAVSEIEPVPEPTVEDNLERSQAVALVNHFLASLDEDKRTVFELCDIEGLRGPEVAEILDVSVNVIYSRLRRARLRFEEFVNAHHAQIKLQAERFGKAWSE